MTWSLIHVLISTKFSYSSVEVRISMSNYISLFCVDVTTHPCGNPSAKLPNTVSGSLLYQQRRAELALSQHKLPWLFSQSVEQVRSQMSTCEQWLRVELPNDPRLNPNSGYHNLSVKVFLVGCFEWIFKWKRLNTSNNYVNRSLCSKFTRCAQVSLIVIYFARDFVLMSGLYCEWEHHGC